jgi:hypothetical protein
VIFAVAEAQVPDVDSHHLMGAWSDLVVGEQPHGLVESYLLRGEGSWQIVSVWDSAASLDRALGEERSHPAHTVFDAAGVDCRHTMMKVAGHLAPRDSRNHQ